MRNGTEGRGCKSLVYEIKRQLSAANVTELLCQALRNSLLPVTPSSSAHFPLTWTYPSLTILFTSVQFLHSSFLRSLSLSSSLLLNLLMISSHVDLSVTHWFWSLGFCHTLLTLLYLFFIQPYSMFLGKHMGPETILALLGSLTRKPFQILWCKWPSEHNIKTECTQCSTNKDRMKKMRICVAITSPNGGLWC